LSLLSFSHSLGAHAPNTCSESHQGSRRIRSRPPTGHNFRGSPAFCRRVWSCHPDRPAGWLLPERDRKLRQLPVCAVFAEGSLSGRGVPSPCPDWQPGSGGIARGRQFPSVSESRTYRLRSAESRFSACSNRSATAGVLKSPVRISRFVTSRP